MTKATARARGVENARSSDFAIDDSNKPGRNGVTDADDTRKAYHRHDGYVGAEAPRHQLGGKID